MVQKLERYLSAMNVKSGIDMSKGNFPDKPWLILAVASLSKGEDEIFDPDYYPSKSLAKAVEQHMAQPVFANVPPHLLAKSTSRGLKLNSLTKAQKVEQQLKMAEARIAKQLDDRERLKQTLQVLNS